MTPEDVRYDYEIRGLSMREIAKEYGCSTTKVIALMKASGTPSRSRRPQTPRKIAELEARYLEVRRLKKLGYKRADLARQYGVTVATVDSMVAKAEVILITGRISSQETE